MALGDIPPTRVWFPEEGERVPPNIGKFEALVREAEALHYRAFLSMGILPPNPERDNPVPSMRKVGAGVKRARSLVIGSYPSAPLSGPSLPSLKVAALRVQGILALPMKDSLTTILNAGSRRERVVACGLDVASNRTVLHRLLPDLLLPAKRRLEQGR
jgi:hypothetical protein